MMFRQIAAMTIAAALAGSAPAETGGYQHEIALNTAWAREHFEPASPVAVTGHQLVIAHEETIGETKLRKCAFGGPLLLGDTAYEHGIGVNSPSELHVKLAIPAARFISDIGLDRNVDGTVASVRFRVVVDGADIFASDLVRPGDAVQQLDLPLSGARAFSLIVEDGGDGRAYDQGDWANARVVLESGDSLWLDELPVAGTADAIPPFSFVYDGNPSAQLLPQWEKSVQTEQTEAGTRHTLTYRDPGTGLEAKAVCTAYIEAPGVDWTIYFTNTGDADSPVLEHVRALDCVIRGLPVDAAPVLHQLQGSTAGATDWLPMSQALSAGTRVPFAAESGRSSKGASPFFACSWPGGGVVTAIGWTGRWDAFVEAGSGAVRIAAGLSALRATLHPGETIRGPRILQVYWTGDDPWRGHNAFRQTMLRYISPRTDGQPVAPPIAHLSTAFYEMDDGDEKDVLSHLESAKGLGFEYFWLDAYRGRDRFPVIGHYVLPLEREVDLNRFPHGLAPISRAAHDAGMKFLLWFEPERISPAGLMLREHPEWVVMPPPDRMGHGGMIDLAIAEACDYVTEYLLTAVREYGIDCLRIDNAVDYGVIWSMLDEQEPGRAGIREVRYVEGLYRMWDTLLAENPQLFIDNCASGGQRIDLETCARSIPLWRTDGTITPLMERNFNEAAIRNQVMTGGLSRYLPFHTSGQMGATPYLFRSGFNAGISFAEDIRDPAYPRDLLAQGIAEGKRLRKYYLGDFYALSDVTTNPKDWLVLQYHRPAEQDGMVMAFRRHESPFAAYECELRDIESGAEYEVTLSHDYVPSQPIRMSGAELAAFHAEVRERPGSLIVEYRRQ